MRPGLWTNAAAVKRPPQTALISPHGPDQTVHHWLPNCYSSAASKSVCNHPPRPRPTSWCGLCAEPRTLTRYVTSTARQPRSRYYRISIESRTRYKVPCGSWTWSVIANDIIVVLYTENVTDLLQPIPRHDVSSFPKQEAAALPITSARERLDVVERKVRNSRQLFFAPFFPYI